jgi:hypothetical protein
VSETTFRIPVLTGEVQRTPIRSGAGLRVPEWQAGAGLDRSSRDAAARPHRAQPVAVVEISCIVRIGRDMQPTGIQLAALPYAGRGLRHRSPELIVNEVYWGRIDGRLHPSVEMILGFSEGGQVGVAQVSAQNRGANLGHPADNILCLSALQANPIFGSSFYNSPYFLAKRYHSYQ